MKENGDYWEGREGEESPWRRMGITGKAELTVFFTGLEYVMSKVILEPRAEGRVLCNT